MHWVKLKSMVMSCIIISGLLCGCTSESADSAQNNYGGSNLQSSVIGNETTKYTSDSGDIQNNSEELSYSIESKMIEEENQHIEYPVIVGLDNSVESRWNSIIENNIMKSLNSLEDGTLYNLKYEVATQTENILSIYFKGETIPQDSKESLNFMYTYNIDMKKGTSIRLESYADIDDLAKKLYSGNGYIVHEHRAEEFRIYIADFFEDEEEIKEMLKGYDYTDSDEFATGYSYIYNEEPVLCIEVNHSLGDYIEVYFD